MGCFVLEVGFRDVSIPMEIWEQLISGAAKIPATCTAFLGSTLEIWRSGAGAPPNWYLFANGKATLLYSTEMFSRYQP